MYTIEQNKLEAITAIINNTIDPAVTEETIEEHITADWHEGDEHQAWIDSASAEEIADWVAVTAYPH